MKDLTRTIKIHYSWFCPDGSDIDPSHVEKLEKSAMSHIKEMMAQGYTSGQLEDAIQLGHGVSQYYGSWKAISA